MVSRCLPDCGDVVWIDLHPKLGHEQSGRRPQRLVQVPLYLAPKVALLYMAMRESKVNNSQLARKLGVSETVVRRMLNPRRHSKPERMEAALEALGKRLQLMVEDAA